mmetsp:Transcript_54993/g.128325  ORF Transcript_54993/g.128325 Transcript_54993/m.128325 type:complete len:592 (-) Transcript_54993:4642-6417(-)
MVLAQVPLHEAFGFCTFLGHLEKRRVCSQRSRTGKICAAHELRIHPRSAVPALCDGCDNERGTTAAVPTNVEVAPRRVFSLVFTVLRLEVGVGVTGQLVLGVNGTIWTSEAHGQNHQLCWVLDGSDFLAGRVQLRCDYSADGTRVAACSEALRLHHVLTRITSVMGFALRVGVVHSESVSPAWPGRMLGTVLRSSVPPGELQDRLRTQANGGAHAIHSSVATANDYHTLAHHVIGFGVRFLHAHFRVKVLLLCVCEEVHGLHDVLQIPVLGVAHVTPHCGASGHDHGVILGAKLVEGDVFAHFQVALEGDALLLHELNATQDLVDLVQLHGRNSIHQQPSRTICPLNDIHKVPSPIQLLRGRQACRPGADDGDPSARALQRWLRLHPALRKTILDDRQLCGLDGHGLLVNAQDTSFLAWCRASSASELREVVGVEEALKGSLPLTLMHKLIPGRNTIAQRASSTSLVGAVAGRGAAVHAAGCLRLHPIVPLLALLGLRSVDLLPIQDAILVISVRKCLAVILMEASLLVGARNDALLSGSILEVISGGRSCSSCWLCRHFSRLFVLGRQQCLLVLLGENLGESLQCLGPLC